jgi:hypothetical protein
VRNVAVGSGVDASLVQREGHLMGELVGLGLRGIGKSAINIDLVPLAVEQARAADRRKPFLIGAAAVLVAGVALWAIFQSVAASKADEKATTMEESRDTLAPLKADIEKLLKVEDDLGLIAKGFTDAESAHVYWVDLISELSGGFASDAVWLTDFDPLVGYNPLAEKVTGTAGTTDAKNPSGTSLIKADFDKTVYGASSLAEMKAEEDESSTPGRKIAAPKALSVNAIRIKGFWRQTPKGGNVVSDLLKNLREHSTYFSFKVKDAKGVEVPLRDDQVLGAMTSAGKVGELGLSFEITLPLAKEVVIK